MKKNIFNVLIISLLFFCTACPYQSAVPLSEKGLAVEHFFLGKWTNKTRAEKDFFSIQKHSEQSYFIEENVYSEKEKSFSQKTYFAFVSEIDGTQYLNVQTSENEKFYLIYQLKKGNNQLILLPLTENIREKFKTIIEFQDFVKKHQMLSFFYESEQVFLRLED